MKTVMDAARSLAIISVICALIEFMCPNGKMKDGINIVIGLTYMVMATEIILELLGK